MKKMFSQNCNYLSVARGNKTGDKMTLSVDAAIAAFNSSTTTDSVKRDIARFWPPFCDWEPHFKIK